MSTTTNPGRCESCGSNVQTRNADLHCPDCELLAQSGDAEAAEATLHLLDPLIGRALDYVHPDDLRELILEKERERTLPLQWTRVELLGHVHALRQARAEQRTTAGVA